MKKTARMADARLFSAPAKVNLYLHVTGRRDDGYHYLDSLITFAGVGDTVTASPATGLTLKVEGPFADAVPAGPENLALKAARQLAAATGKSAKGAAITLVKRLPAAAGLGGGSADAAAALKALIHLWGVDIEAEALAEIALRLGADVPVCLAGGCVFVSGVGEIISKAPPLPPAWLALVNPGVPLSTPAVFSARNGDFSQPAPFSEAPADARALAQVLASRRNDLTEAAQRLAPEVGTALAALKDQDGALLARMSGSGATCFALFAEEDEAAAAVGRLAAKYPKWWVTAAPLLAAS